MSLYKERKTWVLAVGVAIVVEDRREFTCVEVESRGAKVPVARSPWRLNSMRRRQIFWVLGT